jgi:transcriptional regulator with XRE-family HTH domain
MQMETSTIGRRLQVLRKIRDLNQEKVADELSISIGTLSGYERGYRKPDAEMLKKLADYYDTSTDYILGRTNNPCPPAENEPPFDYRIIFQQEDAGKAFLMAHTLRRKYGVSQEEYDKWEDEIVEFYGVSDDPNKTTRTTHGIVTRKAKDDG